MDRSYASIGRRGMRRRHHESNAALPTVGLEGLQFGGGLREHFPMSADGALFLGHFRAQLQDAARE